MAAQASAMSATQVSEERAAARSLAWGEGAVAVSFTPIRIYAFSPFFLFFNDTRSLVA